MPKRAIIFMLIVCAPVWITPEVHGQMRTQPVAELDGQVGLGLMLRKLNMVGSFMMMTAHPDDENNAILAMLSHGQGVRTALVSATRGDGGQNEIGAELFDALAVLRTEELLAAHRFDGAEQYFTRAVDFGYSFSIEETFEKWGQEEILGDFDIAYSTNLTSAAVEAYITGLQVVVMLNETELNYSPLRGQPDVLFVSSPEELAEALQSSLQKPVSNDFFFLDPELSSWSNLLAT